MFHNFSLLGCILISKNFTGLTLDLYANRSTSNALLDRLVGFRLSVHNRDEVPFPEDQGVDINLRKQTSVGIYSVCITKKYDLPFFPFYN